MAEQASPPPSSEQKPPQVANSVSKLKALALWEIGIFEIAFVLVGLVLIFGILNYFNILSLSSLFPKQLGFLPHMPYQQGQTIRSGMTASPNESISKPTTPSVPEAIKKDMQSFAKTYIKPSLIISSFNIKPAVLPNGAILDPNRFGDYWTIENGASMSISARYGQDLVAQDRSVLVALQDPIANLSSLTTETSIAKYLLVQAKGTWNCGKEMTQGKEFVNCVNFWIDTQSIKKEINIISFSSAVNKQNASIGFCERYPQSPLYGWRSCYSQK